MPYTIRPKSDGGFGSFSVHAIDKREALEAAKSMTDRGITEVEILDDNGRTCDLPELERVTVKAGA